MKLYRFNILMNDGVGAVDFSLHADSPEDAVRQARREFRQNRTQLQAGIDIRASKLVTLSVFIDPDSISERHITSVEEYG